MANRRSFKDLEILGEKINEVGMVGLDTSVFDKQAFGIRNPSKHQQSLLKVIMAFME